MTSKRSERWREYGRLGRLVCARKLLVTAADDWTLPVLPQAIAVRLAEASQALGYAEQMLRDELKRKDVVHG